MTVNNKEPPVKISKQLENNQLYSLVKHFNADLQHFKSPFVRLESMMASVQPENKPLTTKLACTVLQYVTKLIPQEHIRELLQNKILPTIFESLFAIQGLSTSVQDNPTEEGLSYDFVDLLTLQETKEDLEIQVKTLLEE